MIVRAASLVSCAALAAALTAFAAGAAPVRIALKSAVALPGTTYTLGDIADVESTDGALRQRLAAIPVGIVPRLAYSDTATRFDVEGVVRRHVVLADVEWAGAERVQIRGKGQHVLAETLAEVAVRALYPALQGQYAAIELRTLAGNGHDGGNRGGNGGINVPAGEIRLEGRVPPAQALGKRMSALVDVRVDGRIVATHPVWFAVRATRPALVARAPLSIGDALKPGDFQLQSVDVTDSRSAALPATASIGELRLRRPLEPGVTLAAAHVEEKPQVQRSEQVAVRVVQGAVTIETTGVALADARIGETIRVKNKGSNESFPARVVAAGVVQVSAR